MGNPLSFSDNGLKVTYGTVEFKKFRTPGHLRGGQGGKRSGGERGGGRGIGEGNRRGRVEGGKRRNLGRGNKEREGEGMGHPMFRASLRL